MMHIHFAGIGGSGVSGLCLMARSFGYDVSGCDREVSPYFKMVKEKGIPCYEGHSAGHIEGVDMLVRSSAVPDTCEDVREAVKRGIKIVSRGTFLAMMMENRPVIGIAGSHGKTSTTWLTYHILKAAGCDPSVYAGGKCGGVSSISAGVPYVIELDESDGSIFEIMPEILVINNLEHEHADFYKTPESMLESFERYLIAGKPRKLITGRGYSLSDSLYTTFSAESFPSVREIVEQTSFQNASGFDFFSRNGSYYMVFGKEDIEIGSVKEPVHVLQNRASALLASAHYLACAGRMLPAIDYREFWNSIPAVDRRFQPAGEFKGIALIDDYAHHPSELKALIDQADRKFGSFGLIFQPHRISRFTAFYSSFMEVLKGVEPLFILPVYSAGEKMEGADSVKLYNDIKMSGGDVYYFDSLNAAADFLRDNIDRMHISALVSAGAGDLNDIFRMLVEK